MADQPNIIFLMPDQLRHNFLGSYGADFLETPNIDRLSDEGVRYERCYSEHPVCVPARVSLLTGLHGFKTGVLDNGQFLRPDYRDMGLATWPEMLNEAGYYTAAIGKMHFYPWDARMGFQYRSIAEDKRWIYIRDDYYHYLVAGGHLKYHGKECPGYFEDKGAVIAPLPWEYTVDHFVGQEACTFIDRYGDEGPFAMMVGFPGPHCPYDPSSQFIENLDPEAMPPAVPATEDDEPLRQRNVQGNLRPWNGVDYSVFTPEQVQKVRTHYCGLVQQIDYEVGQILETLEDQGLLENTIIIFSADHGDYLGDHGMMGKGTYFETSVHVPMIVRLPGGDRTGVSNDLVTLGDVTATMLTAAGCSVPEYMDTQTLPGLGFAHPEPRSEVIGATRGGWWIDDGRWRLSIYASGDRFLFDREKDPDEQNNLYWDQDYLAVRDRLEAGIFSKVMHDTGEAHFDHRVYVSDLSQYTWFGREGWQRPFPRTVDDPQARRQNRA
ncbi:MAG: sulfatase family protein [Anaerolineae bacterium]